VSNPQDPVTTKVIDELAKAPHSVSVNIAESYIMTTHDKMTLALNSFRDGVVARHAWLTPASLGLAFLIALVTCDFKDTLGVSKSVWHAIFILAMVGCILWLVSSIVHVVRFWADGNVHTTIARIANTPDPQPTAQALPQSPKTT
jgi:hypothetical protein